MKRSLILTTIVILSVLILTSFSVARRSDTKVIKKLTLTQKELPKGYIFGKIPSFAKNVFKGNPWMLDRSAIRKLTRRIYPGGDYGAVANIHMSIITKRNRPYNDDIVCYIISYKDNSIAKKEISKLSTFVGYNNDRSIVIKKKSMAILLLVDDTKDFIYIDNMAEMMRDRLEKL